MSVSKWIFLAYCTILLFSLTSPSITFAGSEKVSFGGERLWPEIPAGTVSGTYSRPEGSGPFPAVVILPNCGGPKRFEFAAFWPRFLNSLGYATLNVDFFTPRKLKRCNKGFRRMTRALIQDTYGALAYLSRLPEIDKSRIGVLGSSLGGAIINRFSGINRATGTGVKFSAAVSLYPSNCKGIKKSRRMIPLMIIAAEHETGAASCTALTQDSGIAVMVLADTYHAFDQPSAKRRKNGKLRTDIVGNKLLYSKLATKKAQALVREFLSAKLSGTDTSATPVKNRQSDSPKLGKVDGKDPYKAVSRLDADGDGKVSRAEWDRSVRLFSKIDANADGFLTAQEFHDRWQRR